MKILKFKNYLVPLVLSGEKNSTWRLFDDKKLSVGDSIELREFGKEQSFATGHITQIVEKPFKDLTNEDKKGHEDYSDDDEMYKTYSGYYGTDVTSETVVKIVWFELAQ
jgi:hypothetical protein